MTKWILYFNIVPFGPHTSSIGVIVLGSHWPIKVPHGRYDVIIWTFHPTLIAQELPSLAAGNLTVRRRHPSRYTLYCSVKLAAILAHTFQPWSEIQFNLKTCQPIILSASSLCASHRVSINVPLSKVCTLQFLKHILQKRTKFTLICAVSYEELQ